MTNSIYETFTNSLSQQLSEFELLKSMYPNSDEIILTDKNIIDKISTFLDSKSDYTPGHLDFTLNLFINDLKLEVCVNLPSLYPEEEPDIYVRCNQLNRQQESKLNTEIFDFIKSNHDGEVCLYNVITWLQDNVDDFSKKAEKENKSEVLEQPNEVPQKFVRLWIYSHHIYNKKKRDEIMKKAKELNLTGFCLPGKPGFICIEGLDNNCNEWWKDIKSMTWKRIVIRKSENFELSEQKQQQKFSNFEELHFANPSLKYGKHADMSSFSKYMDKCGLSQEFADILGLSSDS